MDPHQSATDMLHQLFRNDDDFDHIPAFTEVQLNERLVDLVEANEWSFENLVSLLGIDDPTVLWTDEHTIVMNVRFECPERYEYQYTVQAGDLQGIGPYVELNVFAPTSQHTTGTMESLMSLVNQSSCGVVVLKGSFGQASPLPVSSASLDNFVGRNTDHRTVTLQRLSFNDEQCRSLAFSANESVRLAFLECDLHDEGSSFVEAVHANRGAKDLRFVGHMVFSHKNFADFMRAFGKSTYLVGLGLELLDLNDDQWQALAAALAENQCVETVSLRGNPVNDTNWQCFLCSIHHHPSLKRIEFYLVAPLPARVQMLRAQHILEMLKTNTVLTNIEAGTGLVDVAIMEQEIRPRLVINESRPRIQAIVQEPDRQLRSCVFARTLTKVEDNPSLFWKFLSENHDLVA